jgi:hypothetical protein
MGLYLNETRPVDILRKYLFSTLIFIAGVILGVFSKVLDENSSNLLPYFLEVLDLRNVLSRMGIWIFLAVLIVVHSKSPFRSAINVFCFFVGMVSSYYLYTIMIAGFFPESYMITWILMTILSPFLAFVCWYAKGEGIIAICISSIIFMLFSRQAFGVGVWYFYIKYNLELFLWVAAIFVLYQSPKQIIKVVTLGLTLSFLTAGINLFWGML